MEKQDNGDNDDKVTKKATLGTRFESKNHVTTVKRAD